MERKKEEIERKKEEMKRKKEEIQGVACTFDKWSLLLLLSLIDTLPIISREE